MPVVGYPGADKAGRGWPSKALQVVRDHLERKGPTESALTKGAKARWSKLITYNRHDVLGLEHLLRFVIDHRGRLGGSFREETPRSVRRRSRPQW